MSKEKILSRVIDSFVGVTVICLMVGTFIFVHLLTQGMS